MSIIHDLGLFTKLVLKGVFKSSKKNITGLYISNKISEVYFLQLVLLLNQKTLEKTCLFISYSALSPYILRNLKLLHFIKITNVDKSRFRLNKKDYFFANYFGEISKKQRETANILAYPFRNVHLQYTQHYKINLKLKRKKAKVLVVGNYLGYVNAPEGSEFSRAQIYEYIKNNFNHKISFINSQADYIAFINDKNGIHDIVFVDQKNFRVPMEDFYDFLSFAFFYLAAPGVKMSMSHNLIEAAGLDVVPICNYSSHYYEDSSWLVEYQSLDSLESKIKEILDDVEVNYSKYIKSTRQFYQKTLDPSSFKLDDKKNRILLNVENEHGF